MIRTIIVCKREASDRRSLATVSAPIFLQNFDIFFGLQEGAAPPQVLFNSDTVTRPPTACEMRRHNFNIVVDVVTGSIVSYDTAATLQRRATYQRIIQDSLELLMNTSVKTCG